MARRAVALTVILATGHLGASVAAAQGERYVGARIDTVRVDVDGQPVTNPQTLALIETRPGTPLSMIDLRDSLVHLFRLDVYDRIQIFCHTATKELPAGCRKHVGKTPSTAPIRAPARSFLRHGDLASRTSF